jgi:hypothetical protein
MKENTANAYQKVLYPSICLLINGIINVVFNVFLILSSLPTLRQARYIHIADQAERMGYLVGVLTVPMIAFINIGIAPLIIYGAVQMMNLRSYKFSRVAALLTLIPLTSSCCVFGIPIAIWSLFTLGKAEIQSSFNEQ